MNDFASLEASRELYELSGWDGTDLLHYYNDYTTPRIIGNTWVVYNDRTKANFEVDERDGDVVIPAYTLGYLLRKLPLGSYEIYIGENGYAQLQQMVGKPFPFAEGATIEDAAAKLAIELFKQGVLTRDGDE